MKSSMPNRHSLGSALVVFALFVGFCLTSTHAQQAPTTAQKQTAETAAANLTAKSANVSDSGAAVRISIFRWSTDEERSVFLGAMNPALAAAAPARGGGARGGRGGAARGGRGAAPVDDAAVDDPAAVDNGGAAPAGRGGGRGGRGGAARGGRGGDAAAPSAPPDPIATLTTAIEKATSVGYIWTNEVVGYSIKYAYHTSLPDGSERIIVAADRRLGGYNPAWKLVAAATPTNYDFTLIEMRLDSKGMGEGKTSLTNKVILDNDAKSLALDNYAAAPVILQNVKR